MTRKLASSSSIARQTRVFLAGFALLILGACTTVLDVSSLSSSILSDSNTEEKNSQATEQTKCLQILALGGSVTAGSTGFAARHPDAPLNFSKDAWPEMFQNVLNNKFPCSDGNSTKHSVINAATNGCSAKCHLDKWSENYHTFAEQHWDLVIIEPTANTYPHEMNHLKALVAAFATISLSPSPSFILLSASFRLPKDQNPNMYEELPPIENEVAKFSQQWDIPFVSFPKYIFMNNMYNASNHLAWCIEARCNFWLDQVHITKTSHKMIGKMLGNALATNNLYDTVNLDIEINSNVSINAASLVLPPKLNLTIDDLPPEIKKLLPSKAAVWMSFRTKILPDADDNLVCMEGFKPHNSRERFSTMYMYGMTNNTNYTQPGNNASFVFKIPKAQCDKTGSNSGYNVQIEYLHSYTTPGAMDLLYWREGENRSSHTLCDPEIEQNSDGWGMVGTFNSSNEKQVSVSNSMKYKIDRDVSLIKGVVYGGDFHLLSVALFCL